MAQMSFDEKEKLEKVIKEILEENKTSNYQEDHK